MGSKASMSGSTSGSQEHGDLSSGKYEHSTSAGASDPAEDISRRAADVADTAKQVAEEAGERLTVTMEDQKRAGAQRLSQFAQAVVTAANQLDRDSPEFARYVRGAAEQVQGLSEKLRSQNVSELFKEFQLFAKRHPTAFLGATVLTGFALARFLKSATDDSQGSGQSASRTSHNQHSGMATAPNGNSNRRS